MTLAGIGPDGRLPPLPGSSRLRSQRRRAVGRTVRWLRVSRSPPGPRPPPHSPFTALPSLVARSPLLGPGRAPPARSFEGLVGHGLGLTSREQPAGGGRDERHADEDEQEILRRDAAEG